MKRCFGILLVTFLLIGCKEEATEVEIRLFNASTQDFKDVVVNTGGGSHEFAIVPAGTGTSYVNFEYAYRYAFVELNVEEDTFTIQPIDYVGEERLSAGKYTYLLDLDGADRYGSLTLILEKD